MSTTDTELENALKILIQRFPDRQLIQNGTSWLILKKSEVISGKMNEETDDDGGEEDEMVRHGDEH